METGAPDVNDGNVVAAAGEFHNSPDSGPLPIKKELNPVKKRNAGPSNAKRWCSLIRERLHRNVVVNFFYSEGSPNESTRWQAATCECSELEEGTQDSLRNDC